MNKKGFSLLELLAVVIIIGVLSGGAVIGVTRYRQDVKEKELTNLHSTLEAGFDNYRSKMIMSGEGLKSEVNMCATGNILFDISYNGDRLSCNDIKKAKIKVEIKGELLEDSEYISDVNDRVSNYANKEEIYIKDNTCMIKTERVETEEGSGKYELVKKCEYNGTEPIPSKEEIICIVLEINEEVLIDDYNDKNSFCKYFGENNG